MRQRENVMKPQSLFVVRLGGRTKMEADLAAELILCCNEIVGQLLKDLGSSEECALLLIATEKGSFEFLFQIAPEVVSFIVDTSNTLGVDNPREAVGFIVDLLTLIFAVHEVKNKKMKDTAEEYARRIIEGSPQLRKRIESLIDHLEGSKIQQAKLSVSVELVTRKSAEETAPDRIPSISNDALVRVVRILPGRDLLISYSGLIATAKVSRQVGALLRRQAIDEGDYLIASIEKISNERARNRPVFRIGRVRKILRAKAGAEQRMRRD